MGKQEQLARAAGKLARQWMPKMKQSGRIAREVLPAAFKPVHSLWHDILAFLFLALAGIIAWKMWRGAGTLEPGKLVLMGIFGVVMFGYGISSYLKSRRISRS